MHMYNTELVANIIQGNQKFHCYNVYVYCAYNFNYVVN